MNKQPVSPTPFSKIALSCSGGGYRASAFHLGSMAYLSQLKFDQVPLLEHVKMISTVSGGTITGIVYALRKQEGQDFKLIYEYLLKQLKSVDLVELAIKKLNPDAVWATTTKRKNLINAFAELYDTHFTGQATFADLNKGTSHLEIMVFNSTEFNHGVDFRFRNAGPGIFGNIYMRVGAKQAAEVKLADAMAASSCLTGGFEPIIWPDDFRHAASPNLDALDTKPTGLMDGGIYDNQGIDAILKYHEKDPAPYFDLIIISDVASPYMDPFTPAVESAKTGFYTWTVGQIASRTKTINLVVNLVFSAIILACGLLPLAWNYQPTLKTGLLVGAGIAFLLIFIIKLLLVGRLTSAFNWAKQKAVGLIPLFYREKLAHLDIEAISLHRAEPLITDRINSLVKLLLDVFLKVVRRLNYNVLYENSSYDYRRVSTLVKRLTQVDFEANLTRYKADGIDPGWKQHSILLHDYTKVVSSELGEIATKAGSFGTTLWFTPTDDMEDILKKLVVAGQATMCFNLLEYLEQVIYSTNSGFKDLPETTQGQLEATYAVCKSDWLHFNSQPDFMYQLPA